jgi:hypothetical protein
MPAIKVVAKWYTIPSFKLLRSLALSALLVAVEIGAATRNRHEDAEPDARRDLHIIEINQARAMVVFLPASGGRHRHRSLVEPDATAGLGQDHLQRGLAALKRIMPQIVAVQLAQVECVEKRVVVSAVVPNEIERRPPVGRKRQGNQSLIACGGSKTVSITVQTSPADCPCSGAGRVRVEIYSISADGTRGVAVAIFVCGYVLVADGTRRAMRRVLGTQRVLGRVMLSQTFRACAGLQRATAHVPFTCRVTWCDRHLSSTLWVV